MSEAKNKPKDPLVPDVVERMLNTYPKDKAKEIRQTVRDSVLSRGQRTVEGARTRAEETRAKLEEAQNRT